MKISLTKDKFRIKNALALVELALFATLLGAAAAFLLFWYRHFYQTITQGETILVLAKEVALQDIDLEKFNKVLAAHEFKTSNLLPKTISNPFNEKQ